MRVSAKISARSGLRERDKQAHDHEYQPRGSAYFPCAFFRHKNERVGYDSEREALRNFKGQRHYHHAKKRGDNFVEVVEFQVF